MSENATLVGLEDLLQFAFVEAGEDRTGAGHDAPGLGGHGAAAEAGFARDYANITQRVHLAHPFIRLKRELEMPTQSDPVVVF